jgi:hypothetical protein
MHHALKIGARALLIGSLLLPAVGCACMHQPPPAPAPPPPPPPPAKNDGTGKGSSENGTLLFRFASSAVLAHITTA